MVILSEKVIAHRRRNIKNIFQMLKQNPLPPIYHTENESWYDELLDLLRQNTDSYKGIFSGLDENGQWVRNAIYAPMYSRCSRPPKESKYINFPIYAIKTNYLSNDDPIIVGNDTLLRCLDRLRAIDYAINKKAQESENAEVYQAIRITLKNNFVELATEIKNPHFLVIESDEEEKHFKSLEEKFNSDLLKGLYDAGLTQGCYDKKAGENLLQYYRNLSSLLVPARNQVTLSYYPRPKVLTRITQVPITKKTEEQQQATDELYTSINTNPLSDEINSHTIQNHACQQANLLYKNLLQDDLRALPAQARKTHLVGAKNAYIVTEEFIPLDDESLLETEEQLLNLKATPENTLTFVRTASPVYVGKGETNERILQTCSQNLEQILKATEYDRIHVTCLNTDGIIKEDRAIVRTIMKVGARELNRQDNSLNPDGRFSVSLAAANALGTRLNAIHSQLDFTGTTIPQGRVLFKSTRAEQAITLAYQAYKNNMLSLINCASGQDRTGTIAQGLINSFLVDRFNANFKNLNQKNIKKEVQHTEILGNNGVELNNHLGSHGSKGHKNDSRAGNLLSDDDALNNEFYTKSAKTNKKNKLKNYSFLKKAREIDIINFIDKLSNFENALSNYQQSDNYNANFHNQGKELFKIMNSYKVKSNCKNTFDARTVYLLNQAIPKCIKALNEPNNIENIKRLTFINKQLGQTTFEQKFNKALLAFAALAVITSLITLAVVFAIPSAGTSIIALAIVAAPIIAAITTGKAALTKYEADNTYGFFNEKISSTLKKFSKAVETEKQVNSQDSQSDEITVHPGVLE